MKINDKENVSKFKNNETYQLFKSENKFYDREAIELWLKTTEKKSVNSKRED